VKKFILSLGSKPALSSLGSEAKPASYSMCIGGPFPGGGIKQPGPQVNHLSPPSAKIKNEQSCTSTPPIRSHGLDRDKYYKLLITNSVSIISTRQHKKSVRRDLEMFFPDSNCPVCTTVSPSLHHTVKEITLCKRAMFILIM